MSRHFRKELKRYYKSISKSLICNNETKKRILKSLTDDINTKIEEGTITSIEDVIESFGTPEHDWGGCGQKVGLPKGSERS